MCAVQYGTMRGFRAGEVGDPWQDRMVERIRVQPSGGAIQHHQVFEVGNLLLQPTNCQWLVVIDRAEHFCT